MDIVFERRGEGPPLVLLHGIGHRWQAWEPVFDLLAAERDVIAVDLPGFGASPALDEGSSYAIETVVERLAEAFDRLGLVRPHIAGNSLGGLFALEAADRGLVSSATALSPAGFYDEAGFRYATTVLRAMRLGASVPGALLERILASPMQRSLMFRMLYGRPHLVDPDVLVADAKAMAKAPGFEKTVKAGRGVRFAGKLLDVPVTIAWGTRDRILPTSQALRARALLPHVEHVWLPGCGHIPMSDDPAMVASVILRTSSALAPAGT
ncbi:alpha/beta fold hydrolase [Actinocorallia longicatena]|uniref:Alpha/beta fold hydrolase n=1 Tax=Actinocorallia longicatena TaxID=111803 RepID=A0ABP6QRZ7_9ACTN